MKMTPALVVIGGLLVFAAVVVVSVLVPDLTITEQPSEIYRDRNALEDQGREIYKANGCTYCHSQAVRWFDWDLGAERVAQAGDYIADRPHLLGSERTGPDLQQEGGEHPDDWHVAHFANPRRTRPRSLMPPFNFLTRSETTALVAYVQSLGFRLADIRTARQGVYKEEAIRAFEAGTDANVAWLHGHVPEPWLKIPNPYPGTRPAVLRGEAIYQDFCIGCHGEVGDGMGPAARDLYPPPFNFTVLSARLRGQTIGGLFYYQIMNGVTGTAMPYFKRELESEKIWDVGQFVAVRFVGMSDAGRETRGIPAAFETYPDDVPQTGARTAPPEDRP